MVSIRYYAPPPLRNDGRCLVSLCVSLSVCLTVCLVPEPEVRMEGSRKLKTGKKEIHDTVDP